MALMFKSKDWDVLSASSVLSRIASALQLLGQMGPEHPVAWPHGSPRLAFIHSWKVGLFFLESRTCAGSCSEGAGGLSVHVASRGSPCPTSFPPFPSGGSTLSCEKHRALPAPLPQLQEPSVLAFSLQSCSDQPVPVD